MAFLVCFELVFGSRWRLTGLILIEGRIELVKDGSGLFACFSKGPGKVCKDFD